MLLLFSAVKGKKEGLTFHLCRGTVFFPTDLMLAKLHVKKWYFSLGLNIDQTADLPFQEYLRFFFSYHWKTAALYFRSLVLKCMLTVTELKQT